MSTKKILKKNKMLGDRVLKVHPFVLDDGHYLVGYSERDPTNSLIFLDGDPVRHVVAYKEDRKDGWVIYLLYSSNTDYMEAPMLIGRGAVIKEHYKW